MVRLRIGNNVGLFFVFHFLLGCANPSLITEECLDSGKDSPPVCYQKQNGYTTVEGDILIDVPSLKSVLKQRNGLAIAAGRAKRWVNGRIPFVIDGSLNGGVANSVREAIKTLERDTLLRFVSRTSEPDYVRFTNDPNGGCYSYLGRQGGEQRTFLSGFCSFGNVLHEIGHVAGLLHEHNRADRDSYVTIDWSRVIKGRETEFTRSVIFAQDLGDYDFGSIMHYPATAFSIDGRPTIIPKTGAPSFGQRNALSTGDKSAIARIYGADFVDTPWIRGVQVVANTKHNFSFPPDVNRDGSVDPSDILWIISEFNGTNPGAYASLMNDVDNDGIISPSDILLTIAMFENPKRNPFTNVLPGNSKFVLEVLHTNEFASYVEIQFATQSSGPWQSLGQFKRYKGMGEIEQFTVPLLNTDIPCYLRVKEISGVYFSSPSAPIFTGGRSVSGTSPLPKAADVPLPLVPSNLRGKAPSNNNISLSWSPASLYTSGYVIQRGTSPTAFQTIKVVSREQSTYLDSSVASGKTYYYRLQAFGPRGSSSFTEAIKVLAK